jgi:hypothetical protein
MILGDLYIHEFHENGKLVRGNEEEKNFLLFKMDFEKMYILIGAFWKG